MVVVLVSMTRNCPPAECGVQIIVVGRWVSLFAWLRGIAYRQSVGFKLLLLKGGCPCLLFLPLLGVLVWPLFGRKVGVLVLVWVSLFCCLKGGCPCFVVLLFVCLCLFVERWVSLFWFGLPCRRYRSKHISPHFSRDSRSLRLIRPAWVKSCPSVITWTTHQAISAFSGRTGRLPCPRPPRRRN